MKLIIDIPDELYEEVKNLPPTTIAGTIPSWIIFKSLNVIRKGTKLPKGHGRLVDADEMVKILRESEYYQVKRGDFYGADVTSRVKNFIQDTETVIEAD